MTGSKTAGANRPGVLPRPKRIRARRGAFQLETGQAIQLPDDGETLSRPLLLAAQQVRDQIAQKSGVELVLERSRETSANLPGIYCRIDPKAALSPRAKTARDAYRLTITPRRIEIAAPSQDGIGYGLKTLAQLVRAQPKPKGRAQVDSVEILDQPDFRDRGIMLDVSRGRVPTQATLEALVDHCAQLRLNVLMLYIEHTFAFRRHPKIGEGASPLSAEAILSLDAYAAERGVELIPCLQSLGHMEHVLGLPEYTHLAESERRWSISPSRPESYALLEDLYAEFLPLFRSKRFNVNCDEPFDLGRGQSTKRNPSKTPGRLFFDHIQRLEKLSRAHGKQLMIWADFAHQHPAEMDRLGKDVILLDWWYEAKFDADRIRKLRRKGLEVWTCPGTSAWNCLFPRVDNAVKNVTRWADAGRAHGASGLLNTDWGDFGHYNSLGASIQSYAWGAQQSWSGELPEKEFDRLLGREVFGDDRPAIGQLYRMLGDIHDAGFPVANGSPLQYLYFDGLSRSFFLRHADRKALLRSKKKIDRVLEKIRLLELAEAPGDFAGLAGQEIAWSAEATQLAIEKSLLALDYNAWRAKEASLSSRERGRLAKQLDAVANRQAEQLSELTRLWLARSETSEFEKTRKRARKSIADLRGAAKKLRAGKAPKPPREKTLALLDVFNEMRLQFGMAPR
ncbi:MAG: glycoside hydrolase family 20 zincin-like fold domain-containing protein [Myxococcota bacterium]